MAVSSWAARFRTAAWLGWQIESNWADLLTFVVYSLLRPIGTALILAGMYWAVAHSAARPEMFAAFYIGNAFHEYVVRMLVGMGWIVVEEREDYGTLKSVVTSPIGMLTYLWGRSTTKFVLATVSVVILLVMGWFVLGVRWDWGAVRWIPLAISLVLGLTATLFAGFLMAGWALLLPRAAMSVNEGVAVALYLLGGVIFPIDLLPRALQVVALALPFTYWYEGMRRFLLGRGASTMLERWPDGALLLALLSCTIATGIIAHFGYRALENRARRLGRIDQSTLF